MGIMMLKILEDVAAKRQQTFDENKTIQLSTVFMKELIDEINSSIGKKVFTFNGETGCTELMHVFHHEEYQIRNRAYRDDTNDSDVEEMILEHIIKDL